MDKGKPSARTPAVTRADVAARAGVSAAVVSYVVNDGPRPVAPATRERVLAAIAELGYRPNAAARALRLGSSELLGLLVPDNRNPFVNELADRVEEEAGRRGYSLVLAYVARSVEQERKVMRQLISRRVDGVIMVPTGRQFDGVELAEANIPLAMLGSSGASDVPSAGTDLYAGATLAVEHLVGHGHERIAMVAGRNADGSEDDRERAWRDVLASSELPEGPVLHAAFTREGGYAAGLDLADLEPRPTAVFVSSDMQAVGLLKALRQGGVRIPEDIALVSFDGSPETDYTWPALTTVRQPVAEMAAAVVDTMVGLIAGQAPAMRREFTAGLLVRQSCGCP